MSDTREAMQDVARAVAAVLPPGTGFVVLAFDHDKPGQPPTGRLDYVANAARDDVCRMMIDFIQRSAKSFNEHELERLLTTHAEVSEEQRQMILFGLAELAMRNPGWNEMLTEIAKQFNGVEMFQNFKVTSKPRPILGLSGES
jgi:hypothetical protein